MALVWHVEEQETYAAKRDDFLGRAEGVKLEPYLDNAASPFPTIGIGFNLKISSIFEDVTLRLFYPDDANPSLLPADKPYWSQLQQAAGGDWRGRTTDDLRAALNSIMAKRESDASVQTSAKRLTYAFNTAAEVRAVFDSIVPAYEAGVDKWVANIPPSAERRAFLSMFFNGGRALLGPRLASAVNSSNRANAFLETRYRSGPIAARNLATSQLIGLSDPGPMTLAQAKNVNAMLHQNRSEMAALDPKIASLLTAATNDFGYPVQDTATLAQPALNFKSAQAA